MFFRTAGTKLLSTLHLRDKTSKIWQEKPSFFYTKFAVAFHSYSCTDANPYFKKPPNQHRELACTRYRKLGHGAFVYINDQYPLFTFIAKMTHEEMKRTIRQKTKKPRSTRTHCQNTSPYARKLTTHFSPCLPTVYVSRLNCKPIY